jgi:hypothetical protein
MRLPSSSAFLFSFSDWSKGAALGCCQSCFDVGQIALEYGLHTMTQQWCPNPRKPSDSISIRMTIVKGVFAMTQLYDDKKNVTHGMHKTITKHTAIITFLSHFWAWMKLVAMCGKHERVCWLLRTSV